MWCYGIWLVVWLVSRRGTFQLGRESERIMSKESIFDEWRVEPSSQPWPLLIEWMPLFGQCLSRDNGRESALPAHRRSPIGRSVIFFLNRLKCRISPVTKDLDAKYRLLLISTWLCLCFYDYCRLISRLLECSKWNIKRRFCVLFFGGDAILYYYLLEPISNNLYSYSYSDTPFLKDFHFERFVFEDLHRGGTPTMVVFRMELVPLWRTSSRNVSSVLSAARVVKSTSPSSRVLSCGRVCQDLSEAQLSYWKTVREFPSLGSSLWKW